MTLTTATVTNGGLGYLLAQGVTTAAADSITYVALGTGCGLLANPLNSGSSYVALGLSAALTRAIPPGASLTIVNGSNSQVVTEAGGGAAIGATSITVSSFVANNFYAVGSGVTVTPAASDQTLWVEAYRDVTSAVVVGAAAGEALASLYVSPPDGATTTYLELGFFCGSATIAANSGVLFARALVWFPHVVNVDSAMDQLDLVI